MTISYILILLLGILIGYVVTAICTKKHPIVGTLRVDSSDPEDGPYLFLELAADPSYVMTEKYITLKVNPKSYISQE